MRIAVCDDDRASLARVSSMIEAWKSARPGASDCTVECLTEGDSLVKAQKSASPFDVILLDIIMPAFNGMEAAREIRSFDKGTKIVFLTSSPEFAVESYSVKASNYLLKPVSSEALFACLDEMEAEMSAARQAETIAVKSPRAVHRIDPASIELLEAHGKHVSVTLASGEVIESIEPLYALEGRLDLAKGFFKCHRSYLVNLNHVSTYTADEVTMRSGYRVPIARNSKAEFKDAYFAVIFGESEAGR